MIDCLPEANGNGLPVEATNSTLIHGEAHIYATKKVVFLANFKPNRGNYVADGGLQTVIVSILST